MLCNETGTSSPKPQQVCFSSGALAFAPVKSKQEMRRQQLLRISVYMNMPHVAKEFQNNTKILIYELFTTTIINYQTSVIE